MGKSTVRYALEGLKGAATSQTRVIEAMATLAVSVAVESPRDSRV